MSQLHLQSAPRQPSLLTGNKPSASQRLPPSPSHPLYLVGKVSRLCRSFHPNLSLARFQGRPPQLRPVRKRVALRLRLLLISHVLDPLPRARRLCPLLHLRLTGLLSAVMPPHLAQVSVRETAHSSGGVRNPRHFSGQPRSLPPPKRDTSPSLTVLREVYGKQRRKLAK